MNWKTFPPFAVLLALMGVAAPAGAGDPVQVSEPWVRAPVPGQKVAGAFMEIRSPDDAALVSASSPVAGVVEIHSMRLEGEVMKMRAVPRVELPAGQAVKLAPGGFHVMLMDLKQPLRKGDAVPLTLTFEGKDRAKSTVEVKAEVREMHGGPQHGH